MLWSYKREHIQTMKTFNNLNSNPGSHRGCRKQCDYYIVYIQEYFLEKKLIISIIIIHTYILYMWKHHYNSVTLSTTGHSYMCIVSWEIHVHDSHVRWPAINQGKVGQGGANHVAFEMVTIQTFVYMWIHGN